MGLDSVELIIRFETEFGIEIADRDAERMTTPLQVAELISSRIHLRATPTCLTRQAFYRIRMAMRGQGIPRSSVIPQLALNDVYGDSALPKQWCDLGDRVGSRKWPGLTRPWLRPFELKIPRGCETVWGLARHVATWDPRVPTGHTAQWWREAVLLRVRQITSEELGINTFNDSDHYIRDLHVD